METKHGEWWNYSWNFVPGCTKCAPECANCWALAMAKRLQGMKKPGYEGLVNAKGQWTGRVNLIDSRLEDPLRLKKPKVIAINLMGDLFHPNVPFGFQQAVFDVMRKANWHTFMVLTKRPENAVGLLTTFEAMPHVWIGTTAGTQQSANERWSTMAWIDMQGWKTWVSSEPLLEHIDWHGWSFLKRLVDGGESGPYARVAAPFWFRSNRDWCLTHGVAYWHKQNGEWTPLSAITPTSPRMQDQHSGGLDLSKYAMTTMGGEMLYRVGRKLAGRLLDGRTWEEE